MERIKPADELSRDASQVSEQTPQKETDLRLLEDLEMVLVGGGSDGVPVWP